MKCRFCKVYRGFKLKESDRGKRHYDRFCPHRNEEVCKDDLIYSIGKDEKGQKVRRYCDGFSLHPMIYCEQHLWISIYGPTSGCLARQNNPEEFPDCRKCNLKTMVQEMVRVNFILERKRKPKMQKS